MIRAPRRGQRHGRLLAVAGLLMCLSFPIFPNDLQAYGNNLAATADDRRRIGLAYPCTHSWATRSSPCL